MKGGGGGRKEGGGGRVESEIFPEIGESGGLKYCLPFFPHFLPFIRDFSNV